MIIIVLAPLMDEIEKVSIATVQATLINKVIGRHDKAKMIFDLIELVYTKNCWKQIKNNISNMSVSILVVDIADNCLFFLDGSVWVVNK